MERIGKILMVGHLLCIYVLNDFDSISGEGIVQSLSF